MNKVYANKGDSWSYPENSESAILSAYHSQENNGVKVDVCMTKDGELVVFNGLSKFGKMGKINLGRAKKGFVTRSSFQYHTNLFQLFLGLDSIHDQYLFHKLLGMQKQSNLITLSKALAHLSGRKEIIIELTGNYNSATMQLLETRVKDLLKIYHHKNIRLEGRNLELMERIKNQCPDLQVGIVIDRNVEDIDCDLDYVSIKLKRLLEDPKRLDACLVHGGNKRDLSVWEINYYRDYLKLFGLVESIGDMPDIITSNPEIIYAYNRLVKHNAMLLSQFITKTKEETTESLLIDVNGRCKTL